ncbi:50S ribosomal protein L6 [Phycisphaerae bacterium RAS1]|nr:50S ribosomal protein L6 [Phycisphaerae bacterium RAS1]
MSRLGKKPVPIAKGVKVDVSGRSVKMSGPKGNLALVLPLGVSAAVNGAEVVVSRADDETRSRAMHGLSRALLANMVTGVSEGYTRKLEIYGTGYTCKLDGKKLLLNVGFMGRGVGKPAQFQVPIPDGLTVTVEAQAARGENEPAKLTVSGADKQMVGQFAAEVRKIRKPEPYKGKGIRYAGEQVRRKAGKVFAGGGA